jgi:hypothetical protein
MAPRQDGIRPTIQTELLQAHAEGGAFLTQTVPMQVWTGVVLTEEVSSGLSVFDRFTLECLIQLGTCRVEDLCEVIGIDNGLATWWLESVEMKGLANKLGEATFTPNIDLCVDALASNSIQMKTETEKTIVWFAQTSEMIVLSPQDTMIKTLSKVEPTARFPFPSSVGGTSRGELIGQSLEKGLLYGDAVHSIVEVSDSKTLDEDTCPAYQLEVNLDKIEDATTKVNIYGFPAIKGARAAKAKRDMVRHSMTIPTLRQFMDASLSKVGELSKSLCEAMENEGFSEPKMLDNRAVATLEYDKARSMIEAALLNCHKRIRFVIDGEMAYEIPLELVPADDKVASLIHLDGAVRIFLDEALSDEPLERICIEYGVSEEGISQRLWQLKHYAVIYQLRERGDFSE